MLLLEERYEEPLLLTELAEDDALLLDDPLVEAVPDSRVVQLFAGHSDARRRASSRSGSTATSPAGRGPSSEPVPLPRPTPPARFTPRSPTCAARCART